MDRYGLKYISRRAEYVRYTEYARYIGVYAHWSRIMPH
jgi:hypothetical protein